MTDDEMTRIGDALRDRLLEEALRLFAERGYRNTSLQDIAVEAGCAKQTLLFHFGSKGGLLAEALDPAIEAGNALAERLADLPDDRVAEAAVTGFVDLALRYRREVALLLTELADAVGTAPFIPTHGQREHLLDALAGRSTRLQDQLRAWMVLRTVTASCGKLSDTPDGRDREDIVRGALRLLIDGSVRP
ncbi:TetR/AcrR family transcriptional regulator [Spirillospora albida]|uniref:TetR/AcrR family transcriptional regulator n=1 Tax=Spirillospora albida TaxID=58123 RepID=UPI000AE6514D|nr:TetR/AcrR family transcriptional regulator [Spirillospora albida]